jgi:1A family penicillin-binding protein
VARSSRKGDASKLAARRTAKRRSRGGPGWFFLKAFLLATVAAFAGFALLSGGVVGAAFMGAYAAWSQLNQDLPSVNQISSRQTYKTAQVFDRHGALLWEFFDEGGRRTVVPLSEISQYMIDAQLAAEDANFYTNPGIDLKGIVRAIYQNAMADDVVSGASTITQQLVRNVLLSETERYDRSMSRKIKEALLAYQMTQKLSKSQILSLYLNEIYYGNGSYGVEAAAQGYFGKRARDLNLAEAALIAGLPASPSFYDPLVNAVGAKQRQAYVLDQMVKNGFVSAEQARAASQAELRYRPWTPTYQAHHWVTYVREQVEAKYGPKAMSLGGFKIYTTLDLELQRKLEEVARSNERHLAQRDANNTAISAINPKTGEIVAMVGSMDWSDPDIDGQVNVTVAERQPGSTIKPLVYLAAFAKGYTPATTVVDEKITLRDELGRPWSPENFDKKFRGTVALRTALGNSLNIPAVKVLQYATIEGVFDLARKMGIRSWTDRKQLGLSMSLGGAEVRALDLTAAYGVIANNGVRVPPVAITRIVDANGAVIEEYRVPQGEQVVDPRYAYMVTSILSDNSSRLVTFGTNSLINLPRPAAVKTGTTDNYRDTWTIGYTPQIALGVWVGNTDAHPMKEVLSSMSAGKVWREAMDATIDHLALPAEPFVRPPGLTDVEVCGDAGMRPGQPACYKDLFPSERAPSSGKVNLANFQPTPVASPTLSAAAVATALTVPTDVVPGPRSILILPTPGVEGRPPPQATPTSSRAEATPAPRAPTATTRRPGVEVIIQPTRPVAPTATPAPKPAAPTATPARRR